MTDPPRSRDAGEGAGVEPDRGPPRSEPPRAPRWVKVSAVIVGVLILLIVIVTLTGVGGGGHGPGRHTGASGASPAALVDIRATPAANPGTYYAWDGSYR